MSGGKMKILMLNIMPLTGSGSGVYVQNMSNALVRQGHEVCVIFVENETFDNNGFEYKCHPIYFTRDDGTKPQVDNEILPFNFPCMTTHPRSIFNFRDLTKDQEQQYCDAFRKAIAEEVKNFKPDIIHSGHIWISSAIAADFELPVVITCHGTDIQSFVESDRYHKYAHKAADACGAIVCISEKNAKEARENFPKNANKAITMPNGYDSHVFYPEELDRAKVLAEFGITKPYKHLVSFAGKFAHFKGIDILLRAAAQYEDEDTATVLAGDGALFDDMCKLRDELGLKNVYFIHNQPHAQLRKLYNVAEVSLAPSRNEPFGLVVIEANACGTPVIGTNDGGIAGILTEETGILIDPEDPDALANEVKASLNGEKQFDRKLCASLTEKRFSQDSLILKTVDLYKKLI